MKFSFSYFSDKYILNMLINFDFNLVFILNYFQSEILRYPSLSSIEIQNNKMFITETISQKFYSKIGIYVVAS
jgi:hypothetical protein